MLFTFGLVDLGITNTFRGQDYGTLFTLGAHLFFHRAQHIVWRVDVLDFVAQYFDAPGIRRLVELRYHVRIDRSAFLERAIKSDLADFRTQGGLS